MNREFTSREDRLEYLFNITTGRYMVRWARDTHRKLIDVYEDYPGDKYWSYVGETKVYPIAVLEIESISRVFTD